MAKTGLLSAAIAGILYGSGLWMYCAGAMRYNKKNNIDFEDPICIILASFFLIFIVGFDWEKLDADDFAYTGKHIAAIAKLCLFILILIGTGTFVGSLLLLVLKFSVSKNDGSVYFGVLQLISTIFINIGAIIWAAGRNYDQDDSW